MPDPCAAAEMYAGVVARSAARSADTMTNAWPPSVSWQQSSRCSGSTIIREAWWSSSVIGLPKKNASGLVAACRRSATATRPKSSDVAPYSCMYRRACIATVPAGVESPIG